MIPFLQSVSYNLILRFGMFKKVLTRPGCSKLDSRSLSSLGNTNNNARLRRRRGFPVVRRRRRVTTPRSPRRPQNYYDSRLRRIQRAARRRGRPASKRTVAFRRPALRVRTVAIRRPAVTRRRRQASQVQELSNNRQRKREPSFSRYKLADCFKKQLNSRPGVSVRSRLCNIEKEYIKRSRADRNSSSIDKKDRKRRQSSHSNRGSRSRSRHASRSHTRNGSRSRSRQASTCNNPNCKCHRTNERSSAQSPLEDSGSRHSHVDEDSDTNGSNSDDNHHKRRDSRHKKRPRSSRGRSSRSTSRERIKMKKDSKDDKKCKCKEDSNDPKCLIM